MRIQTLLQMPARLVVPEEVTQDLEEQHQWTFAVFVAEVALA